MSLNTHIVSRVIAVGIFLNAGGCSNNFSSFSDKTSDESLYYEALYALDKAQYTIAINACTTMSATYLASVSKAAEVCSSAYAGRCGFSTATMASNISAYVASGPTQPLFLWFINKVSGTTAQNVSDCTTAESILRGIGAASSLTTDQNAYLAMLSIYTIAVVVNESADVTDDGAMDVGFDACNVGGTLTNAYAQNVGLAFWDLNASLTQISTNPLFSALATAIQSVCTNLQTTSGGNQDLCASLTPTALSAIHLKGARSLVKEGALVGVDQCGGGATFGACDCP